MDCDDPDQKRISLFTLCEFYFVFIGICEVFNENIPDYCRVNCDAMAFTAAWSIQDHKYNLGSAWRLDLANFISCSAQNLSQMLNNNG